jgi:beta-1,4-mannosyl-glycoprotein beta-1,4-N-acetylglucosaminyltransferase
MFLNENDLYEIRLKTHWDFIDKFIVVEAGETHTGEPKLFNFDHKRFEPYKEKLVYVKFDNFQEEINKYPELLDDNAVRDRGAYTNTDDWIRDHFQANYLVKVMAELGAKDEDLVYISCLDEIIKKSAFEKAAEVFKTPGVNSQGLRPCFGFHYYLYVYKFNLLHKHWKDHVAGMITEFGNFKKVFPTTLRDMSVATHPHIEDAGWHFTFLDPTEGELALQKLKSWAHSKDHRTGETSFFETQTTEEAVSRVLAGYHPTIVDIHADTHPPYILENLDRLQNFIYKGNVTWQNMR